MVGGDAVHVAGLLGYAAEEIAASDHNGDLHAEGMDVGQFGGNFVNAGRVDAKSLIGGKRFAGKLQEYTPEDWFGHTLSILPQRRMPGSFCLRLQARTRLGNGRREVNSRAIYRRNSAPLSGHTGKAPFGAF